MNLIKYSVNVLNDSKLHILDVSPKRGRPKIDGNIKLFPLYTRPVTGENQFQFFRNIIRILST